jgi:hypothetical protein
MFPGLLADRKKFDGAERPDETPESFADPKPPEVRMLTPEQAEQRYEQLWEWFGDSDKYEIPEKFRPRRLRERPTDQLNCSIFACSG